MNNTTLLRISNVLALVATLIMNFLANNPDLFQRTMVEVGESRAIFFLPSGYVFAIWGLIYTLLIIFAIYQFRSDESVERVGWWFVLTCIANVSWLLLFLNDQVWLSTVAMLVLLGSLIRIYLRLDIGHRAQSWAVQLPFSVYLGWISVATVANFAAALYQSGNVTSFLGIGADIWTVIMSVVAGLLALLMLWFRRDLAYALVIVWALYGINARPFDTPTFNALANLNAGLVNTAALAVTVVIGLAVLLRLGWQLQQRQRT